MIISNYLVHLEDQYSALFRELNFRFNKKMIILLKGELGSGKTTFIKQLLAYEFQFHDTNSPTFGLINTYAIQKKLIFHYDLYRIKEEVELSEIGFYDNLEIEAIHFIEWPEIIPNKLIKPDIIISLETIDIYRLISIKS